MPQWDTWYSAYGDKKTTPTETEYGEMMKEPRPDVYDIVSFNKYIGVTAKLDDDTNGGGNIATVKQHTTYSNVFSIG